MSRGAHEGSALGRSDRLKNEGLREELVRGRYGDVEGMTRGS